MTCFCLLIKVKSVILQMTIPCSNDVAKSTIENECHLVMSWFKINSLKMNPDKCHVMVLGAKTLPEDFTILVNDTALIVEDQVTLLGQGDYSHE